MILTNGEIFDAKEPLVKLMEKELPVKISLELAKLACKLDDELRAIHKVRQGVFEKYGSPDPRNSTVLACLPVAPKLDEDGKAVKDKDGNPVFVSNPKHPKFLEEISELMSQETEIVFTPVTLPSTLELSPKVVLPLMKLVKI